MISRRLTKSQKIEILESYRRGETANDLADNYNCSANTINRTVKSLISEDEYISLKEQRLKTSKKRVKSSQKIINNSESEISKEKLSQPGSISSIESENFELEKNIQTQEDFFSNKDKELSQLALDDAGDFEQNISYENPNDEINSMDQANEEYENNFEVIAPLISDFDFEVSSPKSDFTILDELCLPDIVYMIVDKKVELESQSISDLPEWQFLPDEELKRKAIILFSNQRSAKRNCSKNQRVIKIPNTNVFQISRSYIVSKGITRIIHDDSIMALDK
tara:strand:- start:131 stop:967 length:837 start_codon:yes stop_codon:yes gene_type:complete